MDAVGKQRRKKSKTVMFRNQSFPHQHTPICASCNHSSSYLSTITRATDKHTYLHSRLPCGFKDPLVKTVLPSSAMKRSPPQIEPCHKDRVDTREKTDSSSFPHHVSTIENIAEDGLAVQSVKSPVMLPGGLTATAVPLGAPCIMPSPFYQELDGKPYLLCGSSVTEEGHYRAELETSVNEECQVADIGLQTSIQSISGCCDESDGSVEQQSSHTQEQLPYKEVRPTIIISFYHHSNFLQYLQTSASDCKANHPPM